MCTSIIPIGVTADTFVLQYATVASGTANPMSNGCSRLSASIGDVAPGYSSGASYSLFAGFNATIPATGGDALFFDGFEECIP